MILNLNLQQAQLIKDSSIMEHLAEEINKCISAIDKCVGYGNEILNDIKNKNYELLYVGKLKGIDSMLSLNKRGACGQILGLK